MKTFFLLISITISNFLFPCECMMNLLNEEHLEATEYLHKFDHMGIKKPGLYDVYWYTRGRAEAYSDLIEKIEEKCDCKLIE